jgi:hypothetical protein
MRRVLRFFKLLVDRKAEPGVDRLHYTGSWERVADNGRPGIWRFDYGRRLWSWPNQNNATLGLPV